MKKGILLFLIFLIGFVGKAQTINGIVYQSLTLSKNKKSILNEQDSGTAVTITDYFARFSRPIFITYYADSVYSADKGHISFLSFDANENARVDIDMVRVGSGAILMYVHVRGRVVCYTITVLRESVTGSPKKLIKYLRWE